MTGNLISQILKQEESPFFPVPPRPEGCRLHLVCGSGPAQMVPRGRTHSPAPPSGPEGGLGCCSGSWCSESDAADHLRFSHHPTGHHTFQAASSKGQPEPVRVPGISLQVAARTVFGRPLLSLLSPVSCETSSLSTSGSACSPRPQVVLPVDSQYLHHHGALGLLSVL